MNFDLTDEQRMLRDMVREFAEKEIKPRAAEIDRTDEFPWDLRRPDGRSRPPGDVSAPRVRRGGHGHRLLGHRPGGDGAGRGGGGRHPGAEQAHAGRDPGNGTETQKQKYLPAMAKGEKIVRHRPDRAGRRLGCGGHPDHGPPGAGRLRPERDQAVHHLRHGWPTWRWSWRRWTSPRGRQGITLFLVEKGTPGFSPGSKEHLMGVRGMATGEVVFDNCWVPKECLLGGEGEGFKRAMMSLDTGRIGIGCQALGLAQAAMEEAVRYAKQRTGLRRPHRQSPGDPVQARGHVGRHRGGPAPPPPRCLAEGPGAAHHPGGRRGQAPGLGAGRARHAPRRCRSTGPMDTARTSPSSACTATPRSIRSGRAPARSSAW